MAIGIWHRDRSPRGGLDRLGPPPPPGPDYVAPAASSALEGLGSPLLAPPTPTVAAPPVEELPLGVQGAMVGGIVAAAVAMRALLGRGLAAYAVGQTVGVGVGVVLIALAARILVLKVSRRTGARAPKALFGVALVIALPLSYIMVPAGIPVPGKEDVDQALAPLAGLQYLEVPGVDEAMEALVSSNRHLKDEISAMSVRAVVDGARPVGAVVVIGFDPKHLDVGFRSDYVFGFQTASGRAIREAKIAGATVYQGRMRDGTVVTFLDEDGYAFIVRGSTKRTAKRIAKQLLIANL